MSYCPGVLCRPVRTWHIVLTWNCVLPWPVILSWIFALYCPTRPWSVHNKYHLLALRFIDHNPATWKPYLPIQRTPIYLLTSLIHAVSCTLPSSDLTWPNSFLRRPNTLCSAVLPCHSHQNVDPFRPDLVSILITWRSSMARISSFLFLYHYLLL